MSTRGGWRSTNTQDAGGVFSYVECLPHEDTGGLFERSLRSTGGAANKPAWNYNTATTAPGGLFSYVPSLDPVESKATPRPLAPSFAPSVRGRAITRSRSVSPVSRARRARSVSRDTGEKRAPWNPNNRSARPKSPSEHDTTHVRHVPAHEFFDRSRQPGPPRPFSSSKPNWSYSNKPSKSTLTKTPYLTGYEWEDWRSPERRQELALENNQHATPIGSATKRPKPRRSSATPALASTKRGALPAPKRRGSTVNLAASAANSNTPAAQDQTGSGSRSSSPTGATLLPNQQTSPQQVPRHKVPTSPTTTVQHDPTSLWPPGAQVPRTPMSEQPNSQPQPQTTQQVQLPQPPLSPQTPAGLGHSHVTDEPSYRPPLSPRQDLQGSLSGAEIVPQQMSTGMGVGLGAQQPPLSPVHRPTYPEQQGTATPTMQMQQPQQTSPWATPPRQMQQPASMSPPGGSGFVAFGGGEATKLSPQTTTLGLSGPVLGVPRAHLSSPQASQTHMQSPLAAGRPSSPIQQLQQSQQHINPLSSLSPGAAVPPSPPVGGTWVTPPGYNPAQSPTSPTTSELSAMHEAVVRNRSASPQETFYF
eukprot:TRINITY_DN54974_c0_g1_i1.p1 TRINITY_DN54974_c0_g1~~TRINITY_DN54974_c0_g1_i1.p1  ORF type:complete len:588 (+),score=46.17 TRINITY_DN54974_c0_g1_i1:46-1809(+)